VLLERNFPAKGTHKMCVVCSKFSSQAHKNPSESIQIFPAGVQQENVLYLMWIWQMANQTSMKILSQAKQIAILSIAC
jgi:hypothetical protein